MLTNEHIRSFSPLAAEERNHYFQILREGKEERERKIQARVDSQKLFHREKKQRREQFESL